MGNVGTVIPVPVCALSRNKHYVYVQSSFRQWQCIYKWGVSRVCGKQNVIRHLRSAPYHPVPNVLAERAVQPFKKAMKKATTSDLVTRLSRFLFQYYITPDTTTGVSPAELLMGPQLWSHLDLMCPQIGFRVNTNQFWQKRTHDQLAWSRSFQVGCMVFIETLQMDLAGYQGHCTPWFSYLWFDTAELSGPTLTMCSVEQAIRRWQKLRMIISLSQMLLRLTSSQPTAPKTELRQSTRVSRSPNSLMF